MNFPDQFLIVDPTQRLGLFSRLQIKDFMPVFDILVPEIIEAAIPHHYTKVSPDIDICAETGYGFVQFDKNRLYNIVSHIIIEDKIYSKMMKTLKINR